MSPQKSFPIFRFGLPLLGAALLLLLAQFLFSPGMGSAWAALRPAPMSDALAQQLAAAVDGGPVSFLVVLETQVDPAAVLAEQGLTDASPAQRGAALYAALTQTAGTEQAALRAWLAKRNIPHRAFYIVNMVEVQGDAALADTLRRRPEVARLAANPTIRQNQPQPEPLPFGALETAAVSVPWGLAFTHADQVWALGYEGQGIIVASQDTGVQWDHPALIGHYRGWDAGTSTASHPYNWFDAFNGANRPASCSPDAQAPCDDYGHGTHTVGTMLGDAPGGTGSYDRVGMAPQSQWIGCRNMDNGDGTPASYTACFEFFLAPFPQGGDPATDGNPALAPNIINNSWSCPPYEGCDADSLRQISGVMRAAGQMVVAAAGNTGSSCSSVSSPIALYDEVFTVGNHASTGTIAGSSSRGPVAADGSGRMKPDLSAPGSGVYSTYVNSGYATLTGTSMASPHTAGAVALLWSAVPSLIGDIERTEQALIKSAAKVTSSQCDSGDVSPNNVYGYGRLDVYAAVILASQPATLTVTVQDWTGALVDGAVASAQDQATGIVYLANTGIDGVAVLAPLYAGTYTVSAQAPGMSFPSTTVGLAPNASADITLQADKPTPTPTVTPSAPPTPTVTPSATPTPTVTPTTSRTPSPTPSFTPTPTPTLTPTPTICPQATPEALWVDPVISPTGLLTQTLTVYLGNGEAVTVTSPSGAFGMTGAFDANANPAQVTIDLLPDTLHELTVNGRVREVTVNGCTFGGYTLQTTQDRNGDPLDILQVLRQLFLPLIERAERP